MNCPNNKLEAPGEMTPQQRVIKAGKEVLKAVKSLSGIINIDAEVFKQLSEALSALDNDIGHTPESEMQELSKPVIVEVFSDNGEHSHWTLINPGNGIKLWSEEPEECKAMGYPVKQPQPEAKPEQPIKFTLLTKDEVEKDRSSAYEYLFKNEYPTPAPAMPEGKTKEEDSYESTQNTNSFWGYLRHLIDEHASQEVTKVTKELTGEITRLKSEIDELRKERIEIIEQLEKMSNEYEVLDGGYIIYKTTLDHYIETLENKQFLPSNPNTETINTEKKEI